MAAAEVKRDLEQMDKWPREIKRKGQLLLPRLFFCFIASY